MRVQYTKKLTEIVKDSEIIPMNNDLFMSEIKKLEERRAKLRESNIDTKLCDINDSKFDKSDIVIIDQDLLKIYGSNLTGESTAYLIRCFSKAKFIIGLNQYGNNSFDLTLKGHLNSYFDINIGAEQLGNPGLWTDKRTQFRPWVWPEILKYLNDYDKRINDVVKNRDTSILKFLKLDAYVNYLSRDSLSFLSDNEINFKDFVLTSGNGLKLKDKIPTEQIDIIAVSRISKWLERLVLPGQDVLVDAPHMVYRLPCLLENDITIIENWNKTTKFLNKNELGISYQQIDKYLYSKNYWLSRIVWYWIPISKDEAIQDINKPFLRKNIPYRFCEDSSSFINYNDCLEFKASLETPYNKRFINRNNLTLASFIPKINLE